MLTGLSLIASAPPKASAANPGTINFQGKVVNPDGTNVTNGSYSFVFRLYQNVNINTYNPNSLVCASDTNCWWEETDTLTVTNGVFQVELGATCAFTGACNSGHSGINFNTQNSLSLTMKFNSDAAGYMTPLLHLQSVPYAYNADNLGGIGASGFIQNTTTPQSANIAIQSSSSTNIGEVIKGAASQSADFFQVQDSSGNILDRLDAGGNFDSSGYLTNPSGGLGAFGNALNYSEGFDNIFAWLRTNVTAPTADTIVDPTGATTAEALADTLSGGKIYETSGIVPTSTSYTFSVWLKAPSGTQNVDLRIDGSTTGTGTVKTVTATTTWQRFFVTQDVSLFTGFVQPTIFPGGTGGSATIQAWGAQLVQGTAMGTYTRTGNGLVQAVNRGLVSNGIVYVDPQDSATAFQVSTGHQSPIFTVDTLNRKIVLGQNNQFSGTIVFNDSAGNNTVTLAAQGADPTSSVSIFLPTAGGTGTQCLQSTSGSTSTSTVLQFGSCAGTTPTLAAVYAAGTGPTDQTILLSSADGGGVIIKDNATSVGTAFQVQTSGAANIFSVDATNKRVVVGSTGTSAAQLYVSGSVPAAILGNVTGTNLSDVKVQGKYAYIADCNDSFRVADVSNPASPVIISSTSTGASTCAQALAVSGHYAYVALYFTNSLRVYDISNPFAPTALGTVALTGGSGPNSVYVQGRYVYTANFANFTFSVVDVANPSNPILLTSFTTANANYGLFVSGDYLYTANDSNNLVIYDISNPAVPVTKGSVALGGSVSCAGSLGADVVYVQGRYAYVTVCATDTVKIFDISDPSTPVAVGSGISTGASSGPQGIAIQGRYAYVALITSDSMGIYDISNLSSPATVGTVSNGASSDPNGIVVSGRYAYVSSYTSGQMNIYDLGGAYVQQLEAGGSEFGTLSVTSNSAFAGDASIQGGLSVGQGLQVTGTLGVGAASPPSTDMVSISNAGQGATLTGVDGLAVNFSTGGTTASTDNSGLRIDVTSNNSGATTTLEGLKIGDLSSAEANSTETGLYVGTGWDIGLDLQSGVIQLAALSSNPPAPSAGNLRIYAKTVSGRVVPKWIGSAGVDTPFQAALWGNNTAMWTTTGATAGLWTGTTGAGLGTYSTALPTTTNLYTSMIRGRWASVVTTLNQQLGQRSAQNQFYRGNTSGQGGFFFFARFGTEAWTAGDRLYVGFGTGTTAMVTGNPSALTNTLGFGIDAGDTAITFMHNDNTSTATKDTIAGQPTLASNQGYDAYIYAKPNDSTIYYRLDDLNSGTTIIDTSTNTNLPVNTTMMAVFALMSNGANTPVTSAQIGVNRIYVETDH